jgi:predicted transcriptional regulator
MAKRTTIRLVPSLQEDLSKLAEEMQVSYNQLVNYALARFVEAQQGWPLLEERARRGSRAAFLRALKRADRKKREPEPEDTLPPGYKRQTMIARLKRDT